MAKASPGLAWWCVPLVLCVALLAPLTIADLPPLLDYPNHLARLFVLASLPGDPILSQFYRTHWSIIPNLALDLVVPPLLVVFPVHIVGRCVIGVALLLPVAGAIAYHRALSGRLSYWPLASVLFAYNAASLRGFLNFIISIGFALLFAAAWVAWRERKPARAIAVASIGAVVLFFSHLTGLLFFAIMLGAYELDWLRTASFRIGALARRFAAGALVFIAPAVLYAASDLGQTQGQAVFRSVAGKLNAALFPVINYLLPLDIATAFFCIVIVVICLRRRWCAIPFQAAVTIGILVFLFIALPHGFKGTWDLDTRFIIMAAFAASASIVPVAVPPRTGRIIGIAFLLLFGARMTVLTTVWERWTADLAGFRAVIASVRPGNVVLTVRLRPEDERAAWTHLASPRRLSDGTITDIHLPALLLLEHRAWWPFLFTTRSQQPLETREPFETIAERVDESYDPIARLAWHAGEMRLFTHVLVTGQPPGPGLIATEGLTRVAGNDTAVLFAVDPVAVYAPPWHNPRPRTVP